VIYSKFGSLLMPLSKTKDNGGRVMVQATSGGTNDVREYLADELKADEGASEIEQAVAGLPWKIMPEKKPRLRNL
jgi:hypothetical protein